MKKILQGGIQTRLFRQIIFALRSFLCPAEYNLPRLRELFSLAPASPQKTVPSAAAFALADSVLPSAGSGQNRIHRRSAAGAHYVSAGSFRMSSCSRSLRKPLRFFGSFLAGSSAVISSGRRTHPGCVKVSHLLYIYPLYLIILFYKESYIREYHDHHTCKSPRSLEEEPNGVGLLRKRSCDGTTELSSSLTEANGCAIHSDACHMSIRSAFRVTPDLSPFYGESSSPDAPFSPPTGRLFCARHAKNVRKSCEKRAKILRGRFFRDRLY